MISGSAIMDDKGSWGMSDGWESSVWKGPDGAYSRSKQKESRCHADD